MNRIAWPQILIGILVTIIVMQWAMPVAQSQSESITAKSFLLKDDNGEVVGGLAIESGEPYLFLNKGGTGVLVNVSESAVGWSAGTPAGPLAILTIDAEQAALTLAANPEDLDNSVSLSAGARTFVSVASGGNWYVLPEDAPETATQPESWGRLKQGFYREP